MLILGYTNTFILTDQGEVVRDHFEKWLEDSGRLEWIQHFDAGGSAGERTGTCSLEDYYDQYDPRQDIIDYKKHITNANRVYAKAYTNDGRNSQVAPRPAGCI